MGFKAKKQTEAEFMAQIVQLARMLGWMVYHTHTSKDSPEGFPDLIMVKGNVQIAAELKVGDNQPTAAQQKWLDALGRAGALVYVWRPIESHWKEIQKVLGA